MNVSKLESRMFVGKSQRQWDSTITCWFLDTPAWVLTITLAAPDVDYWWLLTSKHTRRTWSGKASTLREAEREAGEASGQGREPVKQVRIGKCTVCLQPAHDIKILQGRAVFVCTIHKIVCRSHLKDPCEECDSR